MREAIHQAELRLAQALGYPVAPEFRSDVLPWPGGRIDARGRGISVQLTAGHVQAIGRMQETLVDTADPLLIDRDGDGLYDWFTANAVVTTTDPTAVVLQFQDADALEATDIAPITVSISAGLATISGPAWLLIRPIVYGGVGREALDPSDTALYATSVNVVERVPLASGTTPDTAAAVLTWDALPWPSGCVRPASSDAAATAQAVARVGLRDAEHGIVVPAEAVFNATAGTWSSVGGWGWPRTPDRVQIWYRAGLPLVQGQMAPLWQRTVAYLAAAEMTGQTPANDVAYRALWYWQFDLARAAGVNAEQYSVGQNELENPFGTRRGQSYAWRQVRCPPAAPGLSPG